MITDRKDDHVRLAAQQHQHNRQSGTNQFDEVSFLHHALAGIDRSAVSLDTRFAGIRWAVPVYINAMTGGSTSTGTINRDLAIAARETGIPIATGSMSAYFKDPALGRTYSVMRHENPDGFIMANINATTTVDDARRAVDLVRADALQIHLNVIQETVMPEGDRCFAAWTSTIEQIAANAGVPVIVKEVGFGLSRETVVLLRDIGVRVADVGGCGGTNFARIENGRRAAADYAFLADWGQSTPACLLDAHDTGIPLLASGGIRHPLDIAKGLALGAVAAGVSGRFLTTLLDGGVPALITQITTWIDQLAALMTVLGAPTPADLARCALLIHGGLHEFCTNRAIDTRRLATRARDVTATREGPVR